MQQFHGETYFAEVGAWIDFGNVVCDFCTAPMFDGPVEMGELSSKAFHDGWTRFPDRGPFDCCPTCRASMVHEATA